MQKYQKIIPFLFAFWAGMVFAISFLEAWLKFRAEGVTTEIGLSIGKLVFLALNRTELVILGVIWFLSMVLKKKGMGRFSVQNLLLWSVTVIILLQTTWLLPELIHRAEAIISGNRPGKSKVHLWYVLFEAGKFVLLILLSLKCSQNEKNNPSYQDR